METTENSKQTRVFAVLDDLEQRGERINADKVARLAKMGKQTVLPFYNQWKHQQVVAADESLELPNGLIKSLKVEMARWKAAEKEALAATQEQTLDEIDTLEQERDALKAALTALQTDYDFQTEQLKTLTTKLETNAQQLLAEEKKTDNLAVNLAAEQRRCEDLLQRLNDQRDEHSAALLAQEKQLDLRQQEQINHWMSVVDEARQAQKKIEKTLQERTDEKLAADKQLLDLQHRLDSKSRAHLIACEERNAAQEQLKADHHLLEIARQLIILMDKPVEQLLPTIRVALNASQQLPALKTELANSRQQLTQQQAATLELERAKGTIAALEKQLESRKSSKSEKRQ